ncbi:glycosyltransferase [Acinetobacter sp. ANC 5380]|uniref:Glycosyltransferase n=1 Tax=Acinetobacter terrae TaxID=2731247 RepID=A0A7Y2RIG4_9GAMM|nr:glycosyltransferase [Acinetobacter terrae]NNH79061.1 glycosyltransferase [Acinetobacter terrae]
MNKELMVHVITNFAGVGGAEMMLARLIKQTQNEYDHVVISLMKTSDVYADTLAICSSHYALTWNGLNSFSVLAKLKNLLKQLAPKTVQCWMYHANVMTSLSVLGLANKPKVFWGIHHSLASPKEESIATKLSLVIGKILSVKPAGIIYCAHSSLQQHQQYGLYNSNAQVIANGVSLDKFQPNPNLHAPCVIGFAGRYHTAKGYPYLFETIAKLKDQPVIFKIAGQGANLDNPEIKGYFEQYQLDENQVRLLDQISDMPAFYQSIDAFLMTSITEGFPNVLVEAMASGLPCISTDVGDAKYIVQGLGSIVPPRDADALAKAVMDYVYLSPSQKLELKQLTRQRVEQNFSIEYVSQQYVAAWRQ